MFETDDEPGTYYSIRYDAVREYVDKKQPNFSEYNLPTRPVKAKKRKAASTKPASKAKTVSPKSSPESTKKDAAKLIKLISGDGVDVLGDLKTRLSAGDAKTVQLLKSMYPVDKVKECLLCGEDCVPGIRGKCSLDHDMSWGWEFESQGWSHRNGCHDGYWTSKCSRCGERFSEDGDENHPPNDDSSGFGECYYGDHAFTEKKKDEVLESLEDSQA